MPLVFKLHYQTPSDETIVKGVLDNLASCAKEGPGMLLLKTAGGVHSPTPFGNSQVDAYQSLSIPIHLIADHRRGGISSAISAYESFRIRGYDLDSIMVFEEDYYKNHEYLSQYFKVRGISSVALACPPARRGPQEEDRGRMAVYYERMTRLDAGDDIQLLRWAPWSNTTVGEHGTKHKPKYLVPFHAASRFAGRGHHNH